MKLSIDDYCTKYHRLVYSTSIYLDEEKLKYCIYADDKKGFAEVYITENDKPKISENEFLFEIKYGKIEFKYNKDIDPEFSEEEWLKLIEEKKNELQ